MIKYEDNDNELLNEDDIESANNDVFKNAVPSQYNSLLYEKLKKDRRLDTFIKLLKICSMKNMSMSETCRRLSSAFSGYVRGTGLNPRTLNLMRNRYKDIDEAMSFSKELALFNAFVNASKIAEKTDEMDIIMKFNDMYDNDSVFTNKGNIADAKQQGVSVVVNTCSKETQETEKNIYESLSSLSDEGDNNGVTEQETTDNN